MFVVYFFFWKGKWFCFVLNKLLGLIKSHIINEASLYLITFLLLVGETFL